MSLAAPTHRWSVESWLRANARRAGLLGGVSERQPVCAHLRMPPAVWAIWSAALGVLALVLVAAGAPAVVRAPLVLGYLLVAPGWAICRQLTIPDSAMRITVTIALSVSIVGLITLFQAYAQAWYPVLAVLITALITVTAALIEVARERRRQES